MKIAMLGHKHFPSKEGGVETVVGEIAVRMAHLGHDVTVINRREPDSAGWPELVDGVHILSAKTSADPRLNAMKASISGMKLAVAGGYDVVHVHAEGFNAMDWLASMKKVPLVTTIHGLDWQRAKWGGFATRYLLHAERCAVKHADKIIVLSHNMQQYFLDRYGRETLYIPNGITPIPRSGSTSEIDKLGLEPGGYVLYLGRFSPEKSVELLVDAWRRSDCGKKLVLAGDMTSAYAQGIKASCPEAVTPGFVDGTLRSQLFEHCALFVLPSSIEGMSMALLEALSSGCRVLASDIPENQEAASGLGWMFASGDVQDLTQRMNEALTAEHDALLQARTISAQHDWDTIVQQTLSTYARAIEMHGASPLS